MALPNDPLTMRPIPKRYLHGWIVEFRKDGQRHRVKFRDDEKRSGLQAAEEYINEHFESRPELDRHSITDVIERYLRWADGIKKKATSTLRGDRQRLGVFKDWAAGQNIKSIRRVNVAAIRDFQEYFFANFPFDHNRYRRVRAKNAHATWEKYRQIVLPDAGLHRHEAGRGYQSAMA